MRGLPIALLLLAACNAPKRPLIEDLSGHENFALFKLQDMRGTRDGDRLSSRAMLSDSSSILTIDMRFAVGPQTTLTSGEWKWARSGNDLAGSIAARSVTFLGGQDGPPSIGGSFDLLGPDGAARYRVNLPVAELKRQ